MLSDSEDEKPFILEEPATTSTFSAAIKQQGLCQAGPELGAALSPGKPHCPEEGSGGESVPYEPEGCP